MSHLSFLTKTDGWTDTLGQYHLNNVLLQNRNGPCFLISFINTLILSQELQEDEEWQTVTSRRHEKAPKVGTSETTLRASDLKGLKEVLSSSSVQLDSILYELTSLLLTLNERLEGTVDLDPILNVLPLLKTGLNVNLRLDQAQVDDFGDKEAAVSQLLDLFGLKMVHGFLPDGNVGKGLAFDKAQEFLVKVLEAHPEMEGIGREEYKGEVTEEVDKYFTLKTFFEDNKTQLTEHGLKTLETDASILGDNQFAIFFRNDHFNTIYKRNGSLYLLVNDVGYKDADEIVWQTLSGVRGDKDEFLSGNFEKPDTESLEQVQKKALKKTSPAELLQADVDAQDDELLARELQQEEDAKMSRNLQQRYDSEANRAERRKKKNKKKSKSKAKSPSPEAVGDKKEAGCVVM